MAHIRCRRDRQRGVPAAAGAKFHTLPVPRPFLAPGEGQAATGTALGRQIRLAAHAGHGVSRTLALRPLALRSLALHPIRAPATAPKFAKQPGDEGPDRQKNAVAALKCNSHSGQRRGACRPAPFWQSAPHLNESRSARKKRSIPGADMKSLHRLLLGKAAWKGGICGRDIHEAERAITIRGAIMRDLRPAQGTGTVKINGRLRCCGLHTDLPETGKSVDEHGSLAHETAILDLPNQEARHVQARDDPVSPLCGFVENFVAPRLSACG